MRGAERDDAGAAEQKQPAGHDERWQAPQDRPAEDDEQAVAHAVEQHQGVAEGALGPGGEAGDVEHDEGAGDRQPDSDGLARGQPLDS